ncbi:MAG: hypothetical protein ABIH23_21470 [bacterium]
MPGKTSMTIWYLILAPAVILSALFMGLEIRERIRPGPDTSPGITEPGPQTDSEQIPPAAKEDQREREQMAVSFAQAKAFEPLVTPRPTATRPPEPTQAPTPLPLAQTYKIQNIMGSSAILTDYTLKTIVVRVGQTVDDPLGAFTVEEVDAQKGVRVKLISNGYEKWINDRDKPK